MNILKTIIAPIVNALLWIASALFLIKQGEKNERAKQSEKRLDDIRQKGDIHRRIDNDSDYASRVRDKFRR